MPLFKDGGTGKDEICNTELAERYVRIRAVQRCFARLQLRVQYNKKTGAYDGDCAMVYYHRHNHPIGMPYKHSLENVDLFSRHRSSKFSASTSKDFNANASFSETLASVTGCETMTRGMISQSSTNINSNNNKHNYLSSARHKRTGKGSLKSSKQQHIVSISQNDLNNLTLNKRVSSRSIASSSSNAAGSQKVSASVIPLANIQHAPVFTNANTNFSAAANHHRNTSFGHKLVVTNSGERVVVSESFDHTRGALYQEESHVIEAPASGSEVMIDESGNMVLQSDDHNRLVMDGSGMIIDGAGAGIVLDGNGVVVDENGIVVNGGGIMFGGNNVVVDENGRMVVDERGHVLLEKQGHVVMDNSSGMLVDDEGQMVVDADSQEVLVDERGHLMDEREVEASSDELCEEFVLPADSTEWEKLFSHLVARLSQTADLAGAPCFSPAERAEAEALLVYREHVGRMQVEEQVDIFQRLCALTNAHI